MSQFVFINHSVVISDLFNINNIMNKVQPPTKEQNNADNCILNIYFENCIVTIRSCNTVTIALVFHFLL